jgi:hypothetical protein
MPTKFASFPNPAHHHLPIASGGGFAKDAFETGEVKNERAPPCQPQTI